MLRQAHFRSFAYAACISDADLHRRLQTCWKLYVDGRFPATHRLLRTKKGRKKTTPHSHPKKKKLAIARTAYGGPSNARRSGAHVWLTIRRPMLSTTFESIPHVGHKGLGSKSTPETHPKLLQSNQSLLSACLGSSGCASMFFHENVCVCV